jgi:hypothetical protein
MTSAFEQGIATATPLLATDRPFEPKATSAPSQSSVAVIMVTDRAVISRADWRARLGDDFGTAS